MAINREQISEWFNAPEPRVPIKGVLAGIVLGAIGLATHWVLILAGLAVIGIAVAVYMKAKARYEARPSDGQVDAWLDEDLKALHAKALSKTGTDASELVGEPVMVTGPKFWNVANAKVAFRKGRDNVFRFTPIGATIMNCTAHQLLTYSCVLDLLTGNALNESTDEYFYRDVVSVSTKTKSQNVQLSDGKTLQLNAAETFELTTSGGTSVEVLLRDPNLIEYMGGGGQIPTTRAEKAIQTVRKMLREKKSTPA